MRTTLSLFCLLALLAFATPAQAQLRADLGHPAPAAVYDEERGGLGQGLEQMMSTLFSDDHFRMSHSYEMSFSSFGGGTSLGMYTNTMQWQFGNKWAARVDMSLAHQPFGGGSGLGFSEGQNMRVFLRNAEVAYRPNENMEFRLQVRQSPYGRYASPYGYGGAHRMSAFGAPLLAPPMRQQRGGLFWQEQQRN